MFRFLNRWLPNIRTVYKHCFPLGLNCHTFIGLSLARDYQIYLYVSLMRIKSINIQQYGRWFFYSSPYFIY